MIYNNFKYIYPQVPHAKTTINSIGSYDTGEYLLQPNYEGIRCVVFTNGFDLMVYDYKRKVLRDVNGSINFRKLSQSKNWFVYSGVYCNHTSSFKPDCFIITDVLVWDGEYLLNSTLLERISLLDNAFSFHTTLIEDCYAESFKHILCTEITGIYRTKVYDKDFKPNCKYIVESGYNGVELRNKNTVLKNSIQSRNNKEDNILCPNKTNIFSFLNF